MNAAAAKHVGARLLGEVEEGSLEELLESLKTSLTGGNSSTLRPEIPIPALANIATRYYKATHSAPPPILSISGRYLPLLYHLVSTLIAEPHNYTIVIVDAESRFDVTRLVSSPSTSNPSHPAQPPDLRHVYVYRPARGQEQIRAAVEAAGEYMLYGSHGSRAQEWWGTVVIGGGINVRAEVKAGWKGWLAVQREEVNGFPAGISVEEALRDRNARQEVVDGAGWVAKSRVGAYVWKDV
ncbi:uncharacterized protein F4822DRAFT_195643 [Hypoxylon trugodes]|uniref:uncharacterized protein n=1 Tax=Hypoxylon trugodes TaxID=326681 RepID=UPI00219CF229|nr:uncharacterized protein F4822DRAFT_195643 [Hypoxylon trugodes]KAI1389281.1 hypothetical protein F4822DRAFT_195643 [Hypoxylon trugodes]